MRRFLLSKKKGYVVTLEILFSLLAWCVMIMATVYIINVQRNQKFMYDTYISVATQCSKWGGTNTNMMTANGKTQDIVSNARVALNQAAPYSHVTLSASPKVITKTNNKIYVEMSWTDYGFKTNILQGFPGLNSTHKISGYFNSVAKPGNLLG